jgi:hypothetical protein
MSVMPATFKGVCLSLIKPATLYLFELILLVTPERIKTQLVIATDEKQAVKSAYETCNCPITSTCFWKTNAAVNCLGLVLTLAPLKLLRRQTGHNCFE